MHKSERGSYLKLEGGQEELELVEKVERILMQDSLHRLTLSQKKAVNTLRGMSSRALLLNSFLDDEQVPVHAAPFKVTVWLDLMPFPSSYNRLTTPAMSLSRYALCVGEQREHREGLLKVSAAIFFF